MVGEAFTLRYIPAREDLDQLGAFEGRGHPQREAIEACPPGQVLVMDARRDALAATGGDILMTAATSDDVGIDPAQPPFPTC